jgi:signal transduction histidine kinase
MTNLPSSLAIAVPLFAGAWLALALFLSWRAATALREARAAGRSGTRLRALLDAGPAAALLVLRDGKLEGAGGAAALLGLAALPSRIEPLLRADGPFDASVAAPLADRIRAAMRTGASGTLILRPVGSARILRMSVSPAPRACGTGAALLWLIDVTAEEERTAASIAEAARQQAALAALSRLIEAAPFPIWHRGPDLRLALVNSAYVAAVEGADATSVVASQVELVDEADGRNALREAAEVREAGTPAFRVVPATIAGERRMMQIVELPVGPAGVAGFAIDVEEREQARAELARFQSAQRDMLDRLSAGVAQFNRDRSLVFFNQPFARLFGLTVDFLADRPEFDRVIEAMRDARKLPEPRDFPSWKAERREWFTAGLAAIEEDWELPDRRHLRVVAQPLPDGGLLAVFEDRTRQIHLESDRERMVQVQTTTFDNLAEGIAVFGSNRRLKLWNNRFRELWELDPEALADAPPVEALATHLAGRADKSRQGMLVRDLVRGATTSRRPRSGRFALKDGRQFALAAIPIAGEDVLFTTLDVTDSHRVELALRERTAALEEADRLKTAFVSNISYELRTPLTSIAGFAEMMDAGYAGELPEAAGDYVSAILTSVARLSALIDDILDLTQSDTGGLLLAEEEIEVAEMVEVLVEDSRPAAAAKAIQLSATLASSAGIITGDRRRLGQAVANVLRNAIQFTPNGGAVTVALGGDEGAASILISDTGPGIAPADQNRIFDRFQRSNAQSEGGAGLGLPLARQFVEAHGGTIELQSQPGKGAAFIITLPRTGEQRSAYAEARGAAGVA